MMKASFSFFFCLFLVLTLAAPSYAVTLNEELAYRVRFSRADDVKLLLERGADPNAINDGGLPMVSIASSRTDEDAIPVLKALIAKGADVNKGGTNNQYPIIIAAREDNTALMHFLVEEAQANYTVKDLNGMLPLEIAEHYGNKVSADFIRDMTERKVAEAQKRFDPAKRDAMIEALAFKVCKQYYMYYYYTSSQDKHKAAFVKSNLDRHSQAINEDVQALYSNFQIPMELSVSMRNRMNPVLKAELDAMISNRERRRKGIGKKKDLKARCGRLAEEWHAEYSNSQL